MNSMLAICWAFCAHAALGAGNVLMKKGIAWLGWSGVKNRLYFASLGTWLAGFLVLNLSGIFTALAVKTITPQLVAAFAGAGILVMILLARFLLKEPLFATDLPAALLIVAALALLGLGSAAGNQATWSNPAAAALLPVMGLPLLFFLLGFRLKTRPALFMALSAGSAAGLLAVILKILVARHDYRIAEYLASPFLYAYVFYALLALVALQFALKRAQLMVVGPLQYGSLIVYPALCALLLGAPVPLSHWPLYLAVVLGSWLIMRRR